MMRAGAAFLVFLATLSPVLAGDPGPYRPFFDLYGGVNQLGSSEVKVTDFTRVPKRTGRERAEFGSSLVLGLRNGLWRSSREGFGIWWDLSFFQAKGGTTSMDLFTLSGLVGWGWPLGERSPEAGAWTLYLAGGIGFSFGRASTEAEGVNVGAPAGGEGLDLRLGAMWNARGKNAGYLEVRSLRAEIDAEGYFDWSGGVNERIQMDLDSWQVLIGWSSRLGESVP